MRRAAQLASSIAALALVTSLRADAQVAGFAASSQYARANAESLFEEGVRLSEQNQLEAACEKFEASQALEVAVGTLLRLGDCRERTGRLASAWARFREALALAQTQGMAERARIAAVRSAALEHRVARLVLQVPQGSPPGYTLKVGAVSVTAVSWATPLPVDAGTISVEATAPGYVTYRRYIAVPDEEGARVKVAIPPLEPHRPAGARQKSARPEPPSAEREEEPGGPRLNENRGYAARIVGLSLAAAGGAGLATGGVLAVVARKRHDASLEPCSGTTRWCSARVERLQNESERLVTYAAVSAAIGGGLLVAGLVVYFTAPSARSRDKVAFGVAPDARGGWWLQASGAF